MAERKIGLAAFYNAVYAPRNFTLAPHHYPIIAGLEDRRIENFLFLGPPGAGKSALLSSVYPAWELGHDPTLTTLAVSAGEGLPQGFMAATMQVIQHDPTWAKMFPDVRPNPSLGWSLQRGLFVEGHNQSDPDASYKAVGLQSKALTGLHARLHIYDDIHDRENAATPEMRAQVRSTYYDTLMGRADPRGVRRVAAGRWWAEDDVYQEWISNGDWVVLQLPASRPGNVRLWFDVTVPRGLECVYTETLGPNAKIGETESHLSFRAYYAAVDTTRKGFYWPGSPSKRKEYETVRRRQPRTAAINYDGDMRGGADDLFLPSDFKAYVAPEGVEFGLASPQVTTWIKAMHGDVEQAWDTALGQPQSESLTVALTGLLVPCSEWHCGEDVDVLGACDFHFDVYLLDALVEHVDFRELTRALRTQYAKWSPRMVTVEEKQSGVSLLQTFKGSQVPLRGQRVEQGKMERAINPVLDDGKPIPGGAASVQGWGRMGRIRYPLGASWVEKGPSGSSEDGFIEKVLNFKGGTRASDEFDALVHLVTRAIVRSRRHGRVGVADPSAQNLDPHATEALQDPRRLVMEGLGLAMDASLSVNPFEQFCGAPCHHYGVVANREWCSHHGRPAMAFDGCQFWTRKKAA